MIRALAMLALMVSPAFADPDRGSLLIGSRHLGGYGFEEVNPGVFLTWENRAWGLDYSLGAYRNSYGRGSLAATAGVQVLAWGRGDLSIFAGVALYPMNGREFSVHLGDLVPLIGVQVRQGRRFIQIIPQDGRAADAVLAFGVTAPLSSIIERHHRK